MPVAAQARAPRGETAQEAAARRLNERALLRVGFAGTPAFAARALEAIHRRGYTIALVLTQPDRPSGRGLAARASAVKVYAQAHGLPLAQPASLTSQDALRALAAAALDVLVVAAYGLILPKPVLELPSCGCLNIHASLLPRWRGAAPIARAIEAGDRETGITIMRMDAGLDTGPIVATSAIPIAPRETTGSLHDKLAALGAALIVATLDALVRERSLPASDQPAAGATYAPKIEAADARIDWSSDADALDRRVRALSPAPGAVALWRDKPVKVRNARVREGGVSPGTAVDLGGGGAVAPATAGGPSREATPLPGTIVAIGSEGVDVACGGGVLRLTELQPAGGRPMSAHAFALGHGVGAGQRFANGR